MVMRAFVLNGKKGYTLLELMIVVAIVGILVSLAIPSFQQSAMKAKETALKQNLFTMRAVLDQYYADRGDYPDSLESLVEAKYIRAIPMDPLTKSATTWIEIYEEQEEGNDSPAGVYDIKSGSEELARDGTPYKDW
jgi:general secretion pathway protein G